MKLIGIEEIKGIIELKTGLHIGSGDMEMKIGGTDKSVIKHPHTLEPFIPGSSLKGKVRSLLELKSGLMGRSRGLPLKISDLKNCDQNALAVGEKILKLFGASGTEDDEMEPLGPTRSAFADAFLNTLWKKRAQEERFPIYEVKSENSIDRIKGTALNPRFLERVTSGCQFDFCITLKIFEGDEGLEDLLLEGLRLLQMDALGGNGSRGYGKVKLGFDEPEWQKRFDAITPL